MSWGCIVLCLLGLFCASSRSLDVIKISDAINGFGVDILEHYVNNEKTENIVFSPYSLWMLMKLVSEGASGPTRTEILKAAYVPQGAPDLVGEAINDLETKLEASLTARVKIKSKNGIFADKNVEVKDDFREQIMKHYGAAVEKIDSENPPETANQINTWAAKNIHKKLQQVVTEDDVKDTQMILLNAFLFSADWKIPFNSSRTVESGFFAERFRKEDPWNSITNVQMMTAVGVYPFSYNDALQADVAEIPYKGDQFAMLIIAPDYGLNNTVAQLKSMSVRKVYADLIESQKEVPKDAIKDVQILLPRFSISYNHGIKDALMKLGVQTAFGGTADYTMMAENKISLKTIIHKAGISVKESSKLDPEAEGSEYMYKMYPAELRAERPFLFFILDKIYNTVVFAGLVRNPKTISANGE